MIINKRVDVKVSLSATEIGELWCEMDSLEQATFFNAIAAKVESWASGMLPMQLEYIRQEETLTKEGLAVMARIGEYGTHD